MDRSLYPTAIQLSVRAALSAALGVALAQQLRLGVPLNAMISAVLVTDLSPHQTRSLGLPRLLGTLIGAGVGAGLCTLLGPGAPRVGLGILLAMLLTFVLNLRNSAKVAGYVSGVVLLGFSEQPWWYALHRLTETTVGVVVAVLVSFVPKLLGWRERQEPSAGPEA